jgi:SHS2 domain-containing protein
MQAGTKVPQIRIRQITANRQRRVAQDGGVADAHRRESGRGCRLLPHTADVIVSAWAPSVTGCIDQAVRGLVAVFAEVPGGAPGERVPLACPPEDAAGLLVRVLEEVIYLVEVRGLVPVCADVHRTPAGGLAGHLDAVRVEGVDLVGPVPKAVTRHALAFDRGPDGWRCAVTVDV